MEGKVLEKSSERKFFNGSQKKGVKSESEGEKEKGERRI